MVTKSAPMHEFHLWLVGEISSALAVIGVLVGALPTIVSLAALLWYGMMMWDWATAKFAAQRLNRAKRKAE